MSTTTRSQKSRIVRVEALEPRRCLASYTAIDLPPLPNHESSFALGLNEQEVAVGRSKDLDSQEGRAVVWEVDAGGEPSVSELPGLNGELSLEAYDVNNDGMIAGRKYILAAGGRG